MNPFERATRLGRARPAARAAALSVGTYVAWAIRTDPSQDARTAPALLRGTVEHAAWLAAMHVLGLAVRGGKKSQRNLGSDAYQIAREVSEQAMSAAAAAMEQGRTLDSPQLVNVLFSPIEQANGFEKVVKSKPGGSRGKRFKPYAKKGKKKSKKVLTSNPKRTSSPGPSASTPKDPKDPKGRGGGKGGDKE